MLKSRRPQDPDERKRFIAEQSDARASQQRAQRLEAASTLLEPAIRAVRLAGVDPTRLSSVLEGIRDQLAASRSERGGRIESRSRPATQKQWREEGPRRRYRLFIDESGGTRVNLTPGLPYFAIGGLLVSEEAYADLTAAWEAWKVEWVGRPNATMHSRHLKHSSIRYYANRNGTATAEEALESLEQLIDGFACTLFVMAINKAVFQQQFLVAPVDSFLPSYHYEMCLDFLLERVVYCLLSHDDAHAHVVAEARNRTEDAKLQLEYQRLQLEGTLFQAPSWFVYQLGPHITFQRKEDNVAGLQLVDVLLKAVVDRLASVGDKPLRWSVARSKLYDGGKGRVRGWGLKVFPHDHPFVDQLIGGQKEAEGTP